MSREQIIRAWKDEEFRLSLTDDERSSLPPHPAGMIELTDVELGSVAGGATKKTSHKGKKCSGK